MKKNKIRIKLNKNRLIYAAAVILVLLALARVLPDDGGTEPSQQENVTVQQEQTIHFAETSATQSVQDVSEIPEYCGEACTEINGNTPMFTSADIDRGDEGFFEDYGELDELGRCTAAFACLGQETMPAEGEKRESISSIHPTGWRQARYDCVDSETVLSRAHLIGWMLGAENANEKNLITGTRYMNSDIMIEYELEAADYIDDNPGKHVLYRVTPVFTGDNLMADGILMEAMSLEDRGKSLRYCVFIYNVQPGVGFDYSTGESVYTGIFFDTGAESVVTDGINLGSYAMEKETGTIHNFSCDKISSVKSENLFKFAGDSDMEREWSGLGYEVCSCIE